MATAAATSTGLKRDALGLTGVVYQGVTHIAPAANVLFSWAFIASFAGASMPISLLISVILCFFIANTVAEFSRYTPSAGGYYTFVSRGLGSRFGYVTTWAYIFYDWIGPAGAMGYFGVLTHTFLKGNNGIDIPWWVYALIGTAIVWTITYLGISLSTRTAATLGTLELVIMIALGISFLLNPAPGASFTAPFNPSSSLDGWHGIILGMIFSILALSGFEAAAPLAEETRRPTVFIRQAIMWSLFVVGAFYIFSTYSTAIGFGTSKTAMKAFGSSSLDAWYTAGKGLWHGFWILIYLAILNSILAVGVACTNAASRVTYTMAKAGTLPAVFATIHPRYRTPTVAIHVQQIVGIIAFVAAAITFGADNIFGFLGTAVTVAVIVLYGMSNVALYVYIQREHQADFNLWKHLIMPAVGTIMLIVVLYETITSNQAYPLNWAPWVIVVWLALSFILMKWVESRDPTALERGATMGILAAEDVARAGAHV
jgi:amino acid transporter